MSKRGCPKGTIKRKGYTSNRRGKKVRVKSGCIRATSESGSKRSTKDARYIRDREKIQRSVSRTYGSRNCHRGEIERAGFTRKSHERKSYHRKSGSRVRGSKVKSSETRPTCINDRGLKGKGKKLPFVLEKGILKKFGYSDVKHLSSHERHNILRKVNRHIKNPLSLFRKLNAVATLNRNQDPELANIFKHDARWVRDELGLSSRLSSKSSRYSRNSSRSKTARKNSSGSKRSRKSSRSNNFRRKSGSKRSTSRSRR